MNKVCVVGSINMDMTIVLENTPKPGETVLGKSLTLSPGGKGANQAVAAKRSGSMVYMIGKVGRDSYGKELSSKLAKENINIEGVYEDSNEATGTAIITVNREGQNSIIVVAGSNMAIGTEQIRDCRNTIRKCDVVVAQFEIPIDIIAHSFKYAKEEGKITILNPAPARKIPESILKNTDIIIPNETEIEAITGIKVETLADGRRAAKHFFEVGVKFLIVTLGSRGVMIFSKEDEEFIPAYKVKVKDTTAAGDSFIGGFSSQFMDNTLTFEEVKDATIFGNKVASIAVQKAGAQNSIPFFKEVNKVYGESN